MDGIILTRRAGLMGLAALGLGGCDRLMGTPPAREATVKVASTARSAFVGAVERFAAVRHFTLKTSGSETILRLSRGDMDITLSNKDAATANPLAWQVVCGKGQGKAGATPAEIDEMADELLANLLSVKGVELINSDKPVCGVVNKAAGGLGLARKCDQMP